MALLFIPIPLGMHSLYEWSHPEIVANDPVLQAKALYLNVPFFLLRALIYFALWIGLSYRLNRLSVMQDESANPALVRTFQLWSAPGILVYVLTLTFASIDWVMSLEPHWFSTIYGMIFAVNQVLATLAFVIILATILSETRPLSNVLRPDVFHDIGNLLLAFVMLWAYLSFSQYLIIWSGNLPEEIPWYIRRGAGGWQWLAAVLALFHFAVPLVLLLARGNKRRKRIICGIAIGILVMRYLDTLWLVKPAFGGSLASIHWMDVIAPIAIGGLWIRAMIGQLQKMPLVPLHDPDFERGERQVA
jgi:hypothetical protein